MKRKSVKSKIKEWPDSDWLKSKQYCINQHLQRLDRIIMHYDAVYGHGKLLMVAGDDMNNKMARQWGKIEAAIDAEAPADVAALVEGMARGYAAIEKEAVANGLKPIEFMNWVDDSGEHIFVRTWEDAQAVGGDNVYTMEQVAHILGEQKRKLLSI